MCSKKEVLSAYNELQKKGSKSIGLKEAKGRNIFEERQELEKRFGEEIVEEVFGPPTHLEEAERMFNLIELAKKWASPEAMIDCLINISYKIEFACDEKLDSENVVWKKYATLHTNIPIYLLEFDNQLIEIQNQKLKNHYISVDELKKVKNSLTLSCKDSDNVQKAYFSYMVEAVYDSLKNIFEEVKQEIMGE